MFYKVNLKIQDEKTVGKIIVHLFDDTNHSYIFLNEHDSIPVKKKPIFGRCQMIDRHSFFLYLCNPEYFKSRILHDA